MDTPLDKSNPDDMSLDEWNSYLINMTLDDWRLHETNIQVRVEGQIVNPLELEAGPDFSDTEGSLGLELDLDKVILRHELEQFDVDVRPLPLHEWLVRDINAQWKIPARYARYEKYLKDTKPPTPFSERRVYLKIFFQAELRRQLKPRGFLSWFSKPPIPKAKWAWVATIDVLDRGEIVTIVGRCLPVSRNNE